jgi:hypothetical protein
MQKADEAVPKPVKKSPFQDTTEEGWIRRGEKLFLLLNKTTELKQFEH